MKKLVLITTLIFSFNAYGSSKTQNLVNLLNDPATFYPESMVENGSIGELSISAKLVPMNGRTLNQIIDNEVKEIVDSGNILFRHTGTINNLYSLMRNGKYQVVYKTGSIASNLYYPAYASDEIIRQLKGGLTSTAQVKLNRALKSIESSLESVDLVYLKAWTTVSEYDGIEQYYIVSDDDVVVLTIINCGGC